MGFGGHGRYEVTSCRAEFDERLRATARLVLEQRRESRDLEVERRGFSRATRPWLETVDTSMPVFRIGSTLDDAAVDAETSRDPAQAATLAGRDVIGDRVVGKVPLGMLVSSDSRSLESGRFGGELGVGCRRIADLELD